MSNIKDIEIQEEEKEEVPSNTSSHENPEEYMKDEDVPSLKTYQYVLIYIGFILTFIIMVTISIIYNNPENAKTLLIKKVIIYSTSITTMILNGLLFRIYYPIKINYTRKINHVITWSFPFIMDFIIQVDEDIISTLWNVFFAMSGFIIMMKPSRKYDCTGIFNLIHSTLDRPEDRPNTLKWLVLQAFGVGVIVVPFSILWEYWDVSDFVIIPLIILTFGDGLAEPIGVKFGKHKYKVTGLCTTQTYTRSLEGSSMVFLTAVIIVSIFYNEFSTAEFIANIILVPIVSTLFEAISPHTLDNPIIITCASSIISITRAIRIYS